MSPGDRLGADVWAAALHDRPAVCPSVRPVVGWLASHARPSTCWSSRLCPAAGRRAAAAAAALVDRTACRRRRHLRAFYHNERVYRRLPPPPRRPGPLPGPPTAATVHMEASSPDLPIALLARTHTHTHTHTHSAEVAYICVPQSTGGAATLLKPVSGMTFGTVTMPVGVEILPDVLWKWIADTCFAFSFDISPRAVNRIFGTRATR